ncbi:MAG: DTW domain-containing protein [Deltaproteobacteria bacterium]|nr:DTW domain-containing protein [Deltaproteobacteria bacterium]
MRRVLCLCSEAQPLRLESRLILVMHKKELKATTNSGRIALLALSNSEMRVRGDEHRLMDTTGLVVPRRQSLLLFPSETAEVLDAAFLSRVPGPYALLVPDGTWRQASKVLTREPALRGIPHVKVGPGPASRYQLRREPHAHSLATFEAIARAFGVLEGAEVQARLELLFDKMVERTLWSRGALPLAQCRFPIPPAAIQEFFDAGARGAPRP